MINSNRLGWFARSLMAATLSLPLVSACGDDGGPVTPVVDAPVGEPDACVGHVCPPPGVAVYTLPEVGLLRTELYHYGNNPDGSRQELLGAWMFAFDGQDPPARDIVGPLITDITPTNANCFDHTVHNVLVNGYSAENQAIVDSRTYYDIGESITLTPQAGGTPIEMARNMDAEDPTNKLVHDVIYLSDLGAATVLERNAAYNMPVLAPDEATGFPGLDFYGGYDFPGQQQFSNRTPSLYMPADFVITNPTEEEFYTAGGWQIDSTNDLVMEWTNSAPAPADAPVPAQFTAFASVDPDGRPTIEYICIGPAEAGTHTIPSALFSKPGFPTQGLLLHGQFQHVAWAARDASPGNGIDPDNPDDGHFSFMAVNCDLNFDGGYSLVTP